MATVKGDVHDIGKNIVGVVLACNNYEIIDLGVMVPAEKILQTAIDENADMIGLSGLITPSLDEMVHVAKEMARLGFDKPLLIGGATTSRIHSAVKIDPAYSGPVVHVNDASRSVGVVEKLINPATRDQFAADVEAEYAKLREYHAAGRADRSLLDLPTARSRRFQCDWNQVDIVRPAEMGVHIYDDINLGTLAEKIDWGPFFHAWEMRGAYPAILSDPVKGHEARKLFDDGQAMLDEIIRRGSVDRTGRDRPLCRQCRGRRCGALDRRYPQSPAGDVAHAAPAVRPRRGPPLPVAGGLYCAGGKRRRRLYGRSSPSPRASASTR